MMEGLVLFQVFECVTVVFETFIVYQYISGLFEKKNEQKSMIVWYGLFCFGLTLLSLFFQEEAALVLYTLGGMYLLTHKLYIASTSSKVFSILYFSAIMIGSEILASGLMSKVWGIDLTDALGYGLPRMFAIVVAKLIQMLLVKISVSVASWKTIQSSKEERRLVIPLLLCQVFSMILAYYVFLLCVNVFNGLSLTAFLVMIGIIYMNTMIFWYFDRVKAALAYKSKSETAELKLILQKQYYETLTAHQRETEALWHDMKKHINLMKALLNEGQHEITTEYVRELEGQMDDKIKMVRTEYPVLSALFTEQKQQANKAEVPFEIDVKLESKMRIEPIDLCVALGNLFDNALEACIMLPPEKDRYIRASIRQRNNAIAIEFENTYIPGVKSRRGRSEHGLGIRNIRQVVDKYNGKIKFVQMGEIFIASILIP